MSSIGSGPGLGAGQQVDSQAVRRLAGAAAPAPVGTEAQPVAARAEPGLVSSTARDAGAMPVNAERVAEIKKAIQSGRYPVLPEKISDALIAAGLLLQVRS